ARPDQTARAERIFMFQRAFKDDGDDLHIPVRVRLKAPAGADNIVVEDSEGAPVNVFRVVVIGEREMPAGQEPAGVAGFALFRADDLHHGYLLPPAIVTGAAGRSGTFLKMIGSPQIAIS